MNSLSKVDFQTTIELNAEMWMCLWVSGGGRCFEHHRHKLHRIGVERRDRSSSYLTFQSGPAIVLALTRDKEPHVVRDHKSYVREPEAAGEVQ